MNRKRVLPKFESEAEEAPWVFQNQDILADAFEFGKGPSLSVDEIVARSKAKAKRAGVLVELSATDLNLARKLASKARLHHRDYLKRLLHKAIRGESQGLAKRA